MKTLTILLFLIIPAGMIAQQVADSTYNPPIAQPAYEPGKGPVVFIDEGHYNFHTKDGRYKAFSNLLERDGYVVKGYKGQFEKNKLAQGTILVISNAMHESTLGRWFVPTESAFTEAEIETVDEWVQEGGSLFLIADHMPLGGAAIDLAAAFGFEFTNGFVFDTVTQGFDFFNISNNTLVESIITKGRYEQERVEQVATFTGQGFKIPEDATPILVFNQNYVNMLPDTAWVFDEHTTRYRVEGWSQGAFKTYGKGKIVAFGEAAMFSAQISGPQKRKMGMNNEAAPENYQLLLNIIHWLDGKLE